MWTTGDLASATSLSEKAVRLYADRGLLRTERDSAGRRQFDDDQLDRARQISLLRSLDISLNEVETILNADDPARELDIIWGARRADADQSDALAPYVRERLHGRCTLPSGLEPQEREVPERLLLTLSGRATLPEMTTVIPELTARVFAHLTEQDLPLIGPIHLEIRSRASETYPAELLLCAPIATPARPAPSMAVVLDPTHQETFVSLTQEQTGDQRLIVAVHDYLSATHDSPFKRAGHNREIYLPSFGTGGPGTVMEIAVPTATS